MDEISVLLVNFLLNIIFHNMNFAYVFPPMPPEAPESAKITWIILGTLVILAAIILLIGPVIIGVFLDIAYRRKQKPIHKERYLASPVKIPENGEDERTRCFRELQEEREARINRNILHK